MKKLFFLCVYVLSFFSFFIGGARAQEYNQYTNPEAQNEYNNPYLPENNTDKDGIQNNTKNVRYSEGIIYTLKPIITWTIFGLLVIRWIYILYKKRKTGKSTVNIVLTFIVGAIILFFLYPLITFLISIAMYMINVSTLPSV